MANAFTVNTFTKLNYQQDTVTAAVPIVLTSARVISVSTRNNPFLTTGITDVVYELPINQSRYQVVLVCTETRAAILALINAPLA